MRLLLLVVLASLALGQDQDADAPAPPPWKILPYKPFAVQPLAAPADTKALIDELQKIERPRYGLTATSGGGINFTLTDDAFGRLVRLGPAALPAVLAHLDDKRPTKLGFEGWQEGAGGVFRNRELFVPPKRDAELKAIRGAFPGAVTEWFGLSDGIDFDHGRLREHTVTVGDCCFAILGQIVNRPYEAVRYQPSLIIAVCSPTLDPGIAKAMRAAWGRGDPRQLLARSLQDDIHSRGGGSHDLQAGAAARLMLYFPEQGRPIVARRIAELRDLKSPFPWDLRRAVSEIDNDVVRAGCLELLDPKCPADVIRFALDGLGDKPDPEVERRARIIWDQTSDLEVMLACVGGLPRGDERVLARLAEGLARAEARGPDGYAECQGLIRVLLRASPATALDVCRDYLKEGGACARNVLGALYEARDKDAALALLPPLLDEVTPVGLTGGPPVPKSFHRWHRRLCDYAAAALARSVKGIEFTNSIVDAERDAEIAKIREALAKR